MVGWAWFSIWSLVAGFSSPSGLIFFSTCRALQGMGPALLIPNAIAMIGRTFPIGLKRNIAFACFGAAGPTGAAVGAVFAALIAERLSWPWCFWTLSIFCAVCIVVSQALIPNEQTYQQSPLSERPSFDWAGAFTGVTGLVLVNFALNQAPIVGWNQPYVPVLLGIGFVFLVAFIFLEMYYVSQPLIPIRGLQRSAVLALACVFTGWSSHGIWVYYLYIFLEHIRGHSALLTSAETSPVAVTGLIFAFTTVWLLRRIPVSYVMLAAMIFFLVGSLLIAITPLEQTYWANTFVAIILMPGAMNLSFPAATILLSAALPRESQGIAASLVATTVNYSIASGLGLAGSIHRHTLMRALYLAGMGDQPAPLSLSTPQLVSARLEALRSAYWFAVALSGLGILVALLFIILARKRRDDMSDTERLSPSSKSSRSKEQVLQSQKVASGSRPGATFTN